MTEPPDRILLGMLTPSSNTVLEPTTMAILENLDEVTAHFSRFKVTEITLSESGLAQFEHDRFMEAANLLADAKCHSIASGKFLVLSLFLFISFTNLFAIFLDFTLKIKQS